MEFEIDKWDMEDIDDAPLNKKNKEDLRMTREYCDEHELFYSDQSCDPIWDEKTGDLKIYEIIEQLNWSLPDNIIVPVASGSLYTKVWKGLNEFQKLGLVETKNTRMHIAQPFGCSPVSTAFINGESHPKPVIPDTVAKSLAIGNPADGYYSVRIANDSSGSASIVPEDQVAEGIKLLAETEGIFTETAGGVVISALKNLTNTNSINKNEKTVVLITGTGLKTIEAVRDSITMDTIEPNINSFDDIVTKK